MNMPVNVPIDDPNADTEWFDPLPTGMLESVLTLHPAGTIFSENMESSPISLLHQLP